MAKSKTFLSHTYAAYLQCCSNCHNSRLLVFNPIPAISCQPYRRKSLQWLVVENYVDEMRAQTYKHQSNWNRWRTEPKKINKNKPPQNYLAILHSLAGCAKMWDNLEDSWHCSVCHRSKYEIITNIKNKVIFQTHQLFYQNRYWNDIKVICNHCANVAAAIKRELKKEYELDIKNIYDHITPQQLQSIIIPHVHSAHLIYQEKAKELIETFSSETI